MTTSPSGWVGKTIAGRYQIQELLGKGGMAAVYKAFDPNLKRVVAIKLIHPHLTDEGDFIRRFEEEATAVAQLRHPHIVQVFDFAQHEGMYFIVFEFVPGETLQGLLQRYKAGNRALPVEDAVKYTRQIGEALAYAHSRGMVHRDIKPANAIINVQDDAILMDFGIVKMMGGTTHTATGAVVGTARYMSPEQIKGEQVDTRSDIYSLGVMLFEMLGGRAPFEADSAMTLMMMHIKDPVPNLNALRRDLPPDVVRIVNRALAKDPAQRYQTVVELLNDLRRADLSASALDAATMLEAQPITASKPVSPAPVSATTGGLPATQQRDSAQPALKKNNLFLLGGGALLALLCLGVVGAVALSQLNLFAPRQTAQPTLPDSNNLQNPQASATAPAVADTPLSAATEAPSATPVPPTWTAEPPTWTPEPPTWTPAPPTETATPTGPAVRITNITLDQYNRYSIDYETYGYIEALPGMHIHFFFDTVAPEQAGVPGNGPWILYGGPRPFTGYKLGDKPASATQMCSLVANANHTVIADSGNCWNLPIP